MSLSNYFFTEKRFIVTSAVLLLCAAIFLLFPANNIFEGFVISTVALIIIPILHIKLVLKEDLSQWGLGKGQWNARILMTIFICFLAACGLFALLNYTTDFALRYGGLLPVKLFDDFGAFLLFTMTIVLLSVILYEIFFRGFVLSLFSDRIGWWAVVVQFLIMTIVLFLSYSDQFLLDIPYLLIAFFAGIVGYVTRSVWYTIPFSLLLIILLNTYIISTQ